MRPWEKNIRQVVPYVPGEQPAGDKIVKLNTNENPYPPAPGVKKVLEEMEADRLRKYPDPTASILVKELASYYGLNEDQVFVGVGSWYRNYKSILHHLKRGSDPDVPLQNQYAYLPWSGTC